MLAVVLGVLYLSGYLAFALSGVYWARKGRWPLAWASLAGWTLWNVAWFTAAALIH